MVAGPGGWGGVGVKGGGQEQDGCRGCGRGGSGKNAEGQTDGGRKSEIN